MGINAFGIDLGSSNIRIYNGNDDSYMMEKNMIAIEGRDTLFAYGDSAYEMYEKAPDNISVSYPVVNGVIADIVNMNTLVHYFISDLGGGSIRPADYYITVPDDVTEVEQRAFYDLILDSNVKARNVYTVQKACADAVGMDIDVKNSQGIFIVDVGFQTTEISLLSLGGIVASRLIKVGGQKFDEAIKSAVRKEYNLMIGSKTAEKLKVAMREVQDSGKGAVVYGRDIVLGLPVEKEIDTNIVFDSIKENISIVIDSIKQILERTPPELGADIYHRGIYLTGGGSQIVHMADMIADATGLNVNLSDDPVATAVKGIQKIMKDKKYASLARSVEEDR
ncbi:rod shape-determining protein MreB [Lachnospiraceae bacterium XPB1003]|nr:rod shape-determining protein MreB [Lachnospiraceae bacterium XPB1003]